MSVEKPTLSRDMGQSTGGYEMVAGGVLFALGGLWLDRQLGLTPLLTIVLAILGFAGGVASVYYRYQRDIAEVEAQTEALRQAARHGVAPSAGSGSAPTPGKAGS